MSEQNNLIDISSIIEKQRASKFLVQLIVISWIVTFLDAFDISVIAFAAPYLAPQFHLSKLQMGNIFSAALFGTIIGAFLFGYIGDKIGRRRAIILAATLFGVLTFGVALAPGYHSLLALRVLDGIATGGFLPLIWALNIEYSPKRYRSTLVTLNMAGYSAAGIMCAPISIALIPRFGWRSVFIFGGGLSLLATLFLVALLPESIRYLASQRKSPDLISRILRRVAPDTPIPANAHFVLADENGQGRQFKPSLLFAGQLRWITPLLWIAYVCSSLTTFCLSTWTPMAFEALKYTRPEAALAASGNSMAGMIAALILMRFTDRYGAIAISLMPLLAIPMLLIVGLANLSHATFFMLYPLVGFFVVGGHSGMHSIAGIYYPSAYRSNGTGWASAIAKVGATAGPLLGGVILSSGVQTRTLFVLLAISPAIMAVCVFNLGRIHRRILGREELQAPPDLEPVYNAASGGGR